MHADQPIPLQVTGWRRGFASLWRKEMGEWWRTRKGVVQMLLWILLLDGLMAMVSYASRLDPTETTPLLQLQMELLLNLGTAAIGIGIIIQMQSSLIGERQSGTAAWILSKPASRMAMILAKFGANALSFLGVAVLLPTAIGFYEVQLFGEAPALPAYLSLVLILIGYTLFFLTFTLMLGTLYPSRGKVLGTALGLHFGGPILLGLVPQMGFVTPFALPQIGMALFGFAELPSGYWVPLVATFVWSALFLFIAIRRFEQEEL